MTNIQVPVLANVEGDVSPDGKHIMLKLTTSDKAELQFALASDNFTQFISFVINLVLERMPKVAQDEAQKREITAQPIMVSEMGVARGRTDDEALVSFRAGIFQMMFAVNLATLVDTCQLLQSKIVTSAPKKPN